MGTFLKAEWRNIAIANYIADPAMLITHLPKGMELDMYDGSHYISLVCFNYSNTRLLGLRIPSYTDFEEINLRFYVKRRLKNGEWGRGVVFPKLFFPKATLAFVGNHIYKENYHTRPMRHEWKEQGDELQVSYALQEGGNWHSFRINAGKESVLPPPGSPEEFFNCHHWGHAKNRRVPTRYHLQHPPWEVHAVNSFELDMDHGQVFGPEFASLTYTEPASVMLTKGSEITVKKLRLLQ